MCWNRLHRKALEGSSVEPCRCRLQGPANYRGPKEAHKHKDPDMVYSICHIGSHGMVYYNVGTLQCMAYIYIYKWYIRI